MTTIEELHSEAAKNFQAACLNDLNITLPEEAATEFCRLSNELERLNQLSRSGTLPPIDIPQFQRLWHTQTGKDLGDSDALEYGRRVVIVATYKRQQELKIALRTILIKHKNVEVEPGHVEQFQVLIQVGFKEILSYGEAEKLFPGFVGTVWFDEGIDASIDQALIEVYAYYRAVTTGKKGGEATFKYGETKRALTECFALT